MTYRAASSHLTFHGSLEAISKLLTFSSCFSLQMTAAQSLLRLQMATWSTRFGISVQSTTDCALKEMVRPGQVSPHPPLPGISMMNRARDD